MLKIIVAFDGLNFSEEALQYATRLSKRANAHLVGVFLDDFAYHSYAISDFIGNDDVSEDKVKKFERKDSHARNEAVARFETFCKRDGITHSIHRDKNIAVEDLLHESIYADLLIVDDKERLTHYEEKIPSRFLKKLLSNAQCPVMLVPQEYKLPDKLIFLYDGEPSSVHAIRTFSQLKEVFGEMPVELVCVKSIYESLRLPDNKLIKEYMKQHFASTVYAVLQGRPQIEIINHLKKQKQNLMIVLGAYRRNNVSRLVRPSLADALMNELHASLFIAHNK
jgi:nucleotide-binding universal stress UspA family protein